MTMTQEMNQSNNKASKFKQSKHVESDEKKKSKLANASGFMTRVVIRQLPPSMSEEQFVQAIDPLSAHSEFYYVDADPNLGEFSFSRAYIKFNSTKDVLSFKDKYDNYVFLDEKGNEYPALVEYAPLQKLPRRFNSLNIKKDSKMNTIESDPDFLAFKEALENSNNATVQLTAEQILEEIENKSSKENCAQTTPLVEYLNKKCLEKMKTKEDKKRRKVDAKKKKKEERDKSKKEMEQQGTDKQAKTKRKQELVKPLKNNTNNNSNTDEPTKEYRIMKPPKSEDNLKENENIVQNEIAGKSQDKDDNVKKEPKVTKIRNKDRPTREIYRPGMAKQRNISSNSNEKDKDKDKDEKKKEAVDKERNNQSQNQKYKNRFFTRTKI